MRVQQDQLTRIKNYIHGTQAIVIFFAWALTIAVFTRNGPNDGSTSWFFALCWLTIPILIYVAMVPAWTRTLRFANVYAFLILDALSVVLWLSAWASVASYVSSGKGKGTNTSASGCDNFSHGSPAKCSLSEATIFFGVIVMMLFVGTSYISWTAVVHYRRTGMMPTGKTDGDFASQTQDAFSSHFQPDEAEDEGQHQYDPRQGGSGGYGYGAARHDNDEEYMLVNPTDQEDLGQSYPVLPAGHLSHGHASHDYNTAHYQANEIRGPVPSAPGTYGGGAGAYGR